MLAACPAHFAVLGFIIWRRLVLRNSRSFLQPLVAYTLLGHFDFLLPCMTTDTSGLLKLRRAPLQSIFRREECRLLGCGAVWV
jgi:hypothetical protein